MKRYNLKEIPPGYRKYCEGKEQIYGSISNKTYVEVFQPNEPIIRTEKGIGSLRFMVKGKAKITLIHEDGKQSIVHFATPGEFIGELTFLKVEDKPKNVTAINVCIFLAVEMGDAVEYLKSDSRFLYEMAQIEGIKLQQRAMSKSKNQNYPLKNRLAAYILISENDNIYREKHTETAEYLGVSYRHLLYSIRELVDEGALIKRNKSFEIVRDKLLVYGKDIETI